MRGGSVFGSQGNMEGMLTMDRDLKDFIFSMVRVVLPAAMVVAAAAFITMPYTLVHHPGEQGISERAFDRHMT